MKKKQTIVIYFSIFIIASFLLYSLFNYEQNNNDSPLICNGKTINESELIETRDFYRYQCKTLKRIGGLDQFVKKVPDDTYR